jgi:hypothetical protein
MNREGRQGGEGFFKEGAVLKGRAGVLIRHICHLKKPPNHQKRKIPRRAGGSEGGWKKGKFKYPGRGVQPGEC